LCRSVYPRSCLLPVVIHGLLPGTKGVLSSLRLDQDYTSTALACQNRQAKGITRLVLNPRRGSIEAISVRAIEDSAWSTEAYIAPQVETLHLASKSLRIRAEGLQSHAWLQSLGW
jgi:hypothetical protein